MDLDVESAEIVWVKREGMACSILALVPESYVWIRKYPDYAFYMRQCYIVPILLM